jgi:hypothetical protein
LIAEDEHEESAAHDAESWNKPAQALEEDKDHRQHLNVVFIGHVGKSLQRFTYDLFAHADCSGWMAVHLNSTE